MAEETFKGRVRRELIAAAKNYKEIYVDYEYLICSKAFVEQEYYIVCAEKDNFQHLTGVHSLLSPQIFFDKCYEGTLQEEDFDFMKKGQDKKSAKGTIRRKIQVLPDMMGLFKSGLQAEESFRKNKVCCSFATADGNCTVGFSESAKARPKSLLKGNELRKPRTVDLVFRRTAGAMHFDEMIVGNEESLENYKEKIASLLAGSMLQGIAEKDEEK